MAIAADRPRTRLPPPNRLRPTAGGIKIKRAIKIKIATHLRLTLAGQRAGHTGWCLSRKPVRSRIDTGVFERPSRKLTRNRRDPHVPVSSDAGPLEWLDWWAKQASRLT